MSSQLLRKSLALTESNEFLSSAKPARKKKSHLKLYSIRGRGANDRPDVTSTRKKLHRSINIVKKCSKNIALLRKPCLEENIITPILERNDLPLPPNPEAEIDLNKPEGTVFTEEDFKNFEERLKNEA